MRKLLSGAIGPQAKISVRRAMVNCWRMGRRHRRALCRRLGWGWLQYCEVEMKLMRGEV